MAKKQIFDRKNETLNDYLAQLEELLRKNRGSGTYQGFDVNPRSFLVGGQVVDPSGLGQDVMQDDLKYSAYSPTTIPMETVQTQQDFVPPQLDTSFLNQGTQPQDQGQDLNSYAGLMNVVNEISSIPVNTTEDGGLLYSNGIVRYDDGTSREATAADVPQVIREFSDGSVLLTNGLLINPNAGIGRGYQGLSGLSDLLFGRQQTVTQPYGNINPIEPTPGNVNLGTDFRTKDLPANFNFSFPFPVEVVGITYDDGTRFGDRSGHQGYGNSLYLRLPNGSVIHISHLSDMENFSVGDQVASFDYIGTPGQTGNTYGEHADVEYYNPDGRIADPQGFWIESVDYIDTDKINQSLEASKETLSPEDRQWVEQQQAMIEQDRQMTLAEPQAQAQQTPEQYQPGTTPLVAQGAANLIDKANLTGQYGVGASELLRGDVEGAKAELGRTVEAIKPQAELGVGEGLVTPEARQARISALSQQPKTPYEERGLFGKIRQLAGNVTERVGDTLGIPEGSISETIAAGPTKRTGLALASEIGGEAPEQVPGIRQNIKDIGQDLISKAGEGIESLKEKGSNLFQKTPLMGLFQGQKQVGNAKGASIIDTSGGKTPSDIRDAFFKFGGAQEYADYLIKNAEQAKGGALDTSLFTPEFYQDPNRIANVFGNTSLGKQATGLYKDYLQSQIKPEFTDPYRTERREEGGTLYEYKIPVSEYWQNQYYKDLIGQTPDVLKGEFSYDKFQTPTKSVSASEYKGDIPTQSRANPIFKSGAVDLFKRAGTKVGQLAQNAFKSPAPVYQGSVPSKTYSVPEQSKTLFQIPTAQSISMPSVQKKAISKPSLADYLARGKTVAQYYAETGQQSTLDSINRAAAHTAPQASTPQRVSNAVKKAATTLKNLNIRDLFKKKTRVYGASGAGSTGSFSGGGGGGGGRSGGGAG